ncbi:MAG: transcriptional repressor [Clostridia bacterium]|nr:transcriptional repressor [Clostridia bacterium]
MTTVRFSRQREAILLALRARWDHPTAETLYHVLRETHPNISLGTIYRNLALLEQMGEITRLPGQDSPDRFDGNTTAHDHLHCRACSAMDDLPDMGAIVDLAVAQEMAARQRVAVEGYRIVFEGLCKACATKG